MRIVALGILAALAIAHVVPVGARVGGRDDVAHLAFGALAFVAMYLDTGARGWGRLVDALMRGVFVLALLEVIQVLVPGRTATLVDLAHDVAGCLAAAVLMAPFARRYGPRPLLAAAKSS